MSEVWLSFYLRQFLSAYILREAWTLCFTAIHGVHPYYCGFTHSRKTVISAMKGTTQHKVLMDVWRWQIIGGSGCEPYLQFAMDLRANK